MAGRFGGRSRSLERKPSTGRWASCLVLDGRVSCCHMLPLPPGSCEGHAEVPFPMGLMRDNLFECRGISNVPASCCLGALLKSHESLMEQDSAVE